MDTCRDQSNECFKSKAWQKSIFSVRVLFYTISLWIVPSLQAFILARKRLWPMVARGGISRAFSFPCFYGTFNDYRWCECSPSQTTALVVYRWGQHRHGKHTLAHQLGWDRGALPVTPKSILKFWGRDRGSHVQLWVAHETKNHNKLIESDYYHHNVDKILYKRLDSIMAI